MELPRFIVAQLPEALHAVRIVPEDRRMCCSETRMYTTLLPSLGLVNRDCLRIFFQILI